MSASPRRRASWRRSTAERSRFRAADGPSRRRASHAARARRCASREHAAGRIRASPGADYGAGPTRAGRRGRPATTSARAVGVQAHGDRGCRLRPTADRVGERLRRRERVPEFGLVPEVHARLVLHLPRHARQALAQSPLDLRVALARRVVRVEEDDVDVADGCRFAVVVQVIPDDVADGEPTAQSGSASSPTASRISISEALPRRIAISCCSWGRRTRHSRTLGALARERASATCPNTALGRNRR